jgi:hypothetical protein
MFTEKSCQNTGRSASVSIFKVVCGTGGKKNIICHLLHAGLLLDLFSDPEDGGDIFL